MYGLTKAQQQQFYEALSRRRAALQSDLPAQNPAQWRALRLPKEYDKFNLESFYWALATLRDERPWFFHIGVAALGFVIVKFVIHLVLRFF